MLLLFNLVTVISISTEIPKFSLEGYSTSLSDYVLLTVMIFIFQDQVLVYISLFNDTIANII